MTAQQVTEADLTHGWQCEGCCGDFQVDDWAFGIASGEHGPDPYGLNSLSMGGTDSDYDLTSGCTVSDYLCVDCEERR